MNKAKLKSYAPAARRDFIQAVTDRAHFFGISEKEIVPVEESGDVAIIGGRPFPRAVAAQRRKLDARVKRDGFSQVMEAVAYTWFNRFLALRYMELHGYMEHGFRVLSSAGSNTTPEILDQAAQLDLPGLNKLKVTELKLDGNKDAELYRILLVAQCNALNSAMPFLFEKIEDETELLLPDNLLHSDSLIRKLVTEIEEDDWQEVEIIGWLYQFYISEKKEQVMGKIVKSEDIPAATQLFTPNWIVKYMVQNCLGCQWLATYPDSPLKSKMEYYIEPAEQTDDVKAQLTKITPVSLAPEELTLLDPASGSGHILVEAYDVFKEIYLERGYSNRDFPRLILEKNLYGLDIDDRAAQMAGFALLMKARKDDRRILRSDNPVKLNVMAIQESGDIAIDSAHWGEHVHSLRELIELFKCGKTFGSLIQVPKTLGAKLPVLKEAVEQLMASGDLYAAQTAGQLYPLIKQVAILSIKYDVVAENPPYMGSKYFTPLVKTFLEKNYQGCDKDLFSAFISRAPLFCKNSGMIGIVTSFTWMFIPSFEPLRKIILKERTLSSLVQLEYDAFEEAKAHLCTFVFNACHVSNYEASFIRLSDFRGAENQGPKTLEAIRNKSCGWFYNSRSDDFWKIPGFPIAYWVSASLRKTFSNSLIIEDIGVVRQGFQTGDNDRFLRLWHEVSSEITLTDAKTKEDVWKGFKWVPYNKGGEFRKWFGNNDFLVAFNEENYNFLLKSGNCLPSRQLYFKEGVTWSSLSSSSFSARYSPVGFTFSAKGACCFPSRKQIPFVIALLNSVVACKIFEFLAATIDFNVGSIRQIPLPSNIEQIEDRINEISKECIQIAKSDWNNFETSWDFISMPLLQIDSNRTSLQRSWSLVESFFSSNISRMQELEEKINIVFIEAYNLKNELAPNVSEDQITLARSDREIDIKRLVSYSIGCMMGRYSLDQPGLVYANSGNIGFDLSNYQTLPADDDGIVPVMDMDWFPDDAASRFEEFLKVSWAPETLEENLKFVADSLTPRGGETPRETIRRYISTLFYKDHLQTYKKRPIYWLFSSGKQRAFECLVYLHRYNESTLSRMRNEYVTPLQGKFSAQADYLSNEVNAATSTAERNRLQKQLDILRKKQVEIAAFDDLLRHYADQRISLNLDDGVKVNYGKFGNLLAEVKAVTGGGE
jgi:type II restriction/modification system DNA methylase subunit YeeA